MRVRLNRDIRVLLMLVGGGCSGRPDARVAVRTEGMDPPAIVIQASDLAAYRLGVSREIGLRSAADHQGFVTREERVDSLAAEAAGLPVSRYREVVGTVEVLLARAPGTGRDLEHVLAPAAASEWARQRLSLDSLRLEALVLRARTGN